MLLKLTRTEYYCLESLHYTDIEMGTRDIPNTFLSTIATAVKIELSLNSREEQHLKNILDSGGLSLQDLTCFG